MTEAFCLRCRTQREVGNPLQVKLKNGRRAVSGVCPVCKSKLFRIVKG